VIADATSFAPTLGNPCTSEAIHDGLLFRTAEQATALWQIVLAEAQMTARL
jgi:hypothetical protein